MRNFREKFFNFMSGRRGVDEFTRFLMAAGFVFAILSMLLKIFPFGFVVIIRMVLSALNYFCYAYGFYRIFSRNLYRRELENVKYIAVRNKLMPYFEDNIKSFHDSDYVYKKCPKCSAKLRLKRIKGKHITKCPKCGIKFNVRIFRGSNKYNDL